MICNCGNAITNIVVRPSDSWYEARGRRADGRLCCCLARKPSRALVDLAVRDIESQRRELRTHRVEIAPTVYLVTHVVYALGVDDGEPCVDDCHVNHDRVEYEDGSPCHIELWPALEAYADPLLHRGPRPPKVDGLNEQVELWARELLERMNMENAVGASTPMFSVDRDNRRIEEAS